jgi:predicted PhzF superfamily epimerase YddE/YHI9
VFLDGGAIAEGDRQAVAADLGFSETVFVDDASRAEVRIFTPAQELPLAGHPLVGTAWLLAREGSPIEVLRPPAGEVPTRVEGELVWIRARPEWGPSYEFVELESAEAIDRLDAPPDGHDMAAMWAWEDRDAGRVRARVFPVAIGIEEDEATGSAALRLTAELGREVLITQGRGSQLHARPGPDGTAEVGGRVVLDEVRRYEAPG